MPVEEEQSEDGLGQLQRRDFNLSLPKLEALWRTRPVAKELIPMDERKHEMRAHASPSRGAGFWATEPEGTTNRTGACERTPALGYKTNALICPKHVTYLCPERASSEGTGEFISSVGRLGTEPVGGASGQHTEHRRIQLPFTTRRPVHSPGNECVRVLAV